LARDEKGMPLANPPILWEIESEPILAGTKIIAEAWDAGGLYQVGSFVGHRWAEWNGKFRDDVRAFIKGDPNMVSTFASRLTASPDMYQIDRDSNRSVNFVTCHDGFTLNDTVSYNEKHNEANGENNADGHNYNISWNCGVEGPTDDPAVETLRKRQIKNFLMALLVAQGTPMLLMGDEARHTQNGNNNAYCQNNELSWFNWDKLEQNKDILDFTRGLILLTQSLECFNEEAFWLHSDTTRITWHGTHLHQPDFSESSHSIAFTLDYRGGRAHIIFNAFWEPLTFELPRARWRRIVDTGLPAPEDFCSPNAAPLWNTTQYTLIERSSALFLSE
jgi:glycogen operon protein